MANAEEVFECHGHRSSYSRDNSTGANYDCSGTLIQSRDRVWAGAGMQSARLRSQRPLCHGLRREAPTDHLEQCRSVSRRWDEWLLKLMRRVLRPSRLQFCAQQDAL